MAIALARNGQVLDTNINITAEFRVTEIALLNVIGVLYWAIPGWVIKGIENERD